MKRPSMTVVTKNGIRYDAQDIKFLLARDKEGNRVWKFALLCSGELELLDPSVIHSVEVAPNPDTVYCNTCEGRIDGQ